MNPNWSADYQRIVEDLREKGALQPAFQMQWESDRLVSSVKTETELYEKIIAAKDKTIADLEVTLGAVEDMLDACREALNLPARTKRYSSVAPVRL